MSQKPPPMFSRWESLRIGATPRMARWLGLILLAVLIPSGADRMLRPEPPRIGPIPLPVPAQEWTTEALGWNILPNVLGKLPAPDQRQKNVVCEKALGQFMIEGACWQRIPVDPPCPIEKGAFEHDKDRKCYVRVLRAEGPPQSGDVYPVNMAGEP